MSLQIKIRSSIVKQIESFCQTCEPDELIEIAVMWSEILKLERMTVNQFLDDPRVSVLSSRGPVHRLIFDAASRFTLGLRLVNHTGDVLLVLDKIKRKSDQIWPNLPTQ